MMWGHRDVLVTGVEDDPVEPATRVYIGGRRYILVTPETGAKIKHEFADVMSHLVMPLDPSWPVYEAESA